MNHINTVHVPVNVQRTILAFIYLIGFITYCFFYDRAFYLDGDPSWHLAAGDYIRAIGAVPKTDPWAFTSSGQAWVNLSWLYDVVISWLNERLGLRGLIFIHALIAAAISVVLARICFMLGANALATLGASLLSTFIVASFFTVRPQLLAVLLLSLCFFILMRYRQSASQSKTLLLLTVYSLLLANIHGSFITLFVMGGAFALEYVLARDWQKFKGLLIVGSISLLATLVNPLGYEIYHLVFSDLSFSKSFITEWQPALLSTHPHLYMYILSVMIMPFFLPIKQPLALTLLLLFWVVMTIQASRFSSILIIYATPFLALAISPIVLSSQRLVAAERNIQNDFNTLGYVRTLLVFCSIAIIGLAAAIYSGAAWKKDLRPAEIYPVNELTYLMEHFSDRRVFNAYSYGGYIIGLSKGKTKVFIDGRAETAYPLKLLDDYKAITYSKPGWETLINSYQVDVAILSNKSDVYKNFLTLENWEQDFVGEVATIFVRK